MAPCNKKSEIWFGIRGRFFVVDEWTSNQQTYNYFSHGKAIGQHVASFLQFVIHVSFFYIFLHIVYHCVTWAKNKNTQLWKKNQNCNQYLNQLSFHETRSNHTTKCTLYMQVGVYVSWYISNFVCIKTGVFITNSLKNKPRKVFVKCMY